MLKGPSWTVLALAFALLPPCLCQDDIDCFSDGECTFSLYVDEWPSGDAQECMELCREDKDCEYFTQYDLEQVCYGFASCENLNTESCSQCYSGNTSCPDLVCWESGTCSGNLISRAVVTNEEECHESCRNKSGCTWFTYDEADLECVLLANCLEVDYEDCVTCLSSQKSCGERKDYTKILVIAGLQEGTEVLLDSVEVLDLSSPSSSCSPIANYPIALEGPVGTLVDGKLKVCGGYDGSVKTNLCYEYNYKVNQWEQTSSLTTARDFHGGSLVEGATWFVTGGYGDGSDVLEHGEEAFSPGPELPRAFGEHCQVTVDPGNVVLLGGYNGSAYVPSVYNLNWDSAEWTRMPDLPVLLGVDVCGLIENSQNGKEIVVLAESDLCYIYNLANGTWRNGPPLTEEYVSSGSATVQMNKNFVIVGGYVSTTESSAAVFEFDAETYEWTRSTATLAQPREYAVGIAVPDYMVDCD